MKYFMFCVRDIVGNRYGTPNFSVSEGMARRNFSDEINRAAEDNMLYKHPADFELIALGSYDDELCRFELLDPPVQLVTGKSCVVAKST